LRSSNVVMEPETADSGATQEWRLGHVFELGTWTEPIEIDAARLAVIVSGLILSRLLDVGGDRDMVFDEVAWTFTPVQSVSALRLWATVTSRSQHGGDESFELSLAAATEDGVAIAEGECAATFRDVAQKEDGPVGFVDEPWIALLTERLREDARFAEATKSFDGSIGIRFGRSTLGLRVYRGKVIDQGRSMFSAATFSVGASTREWLEFARRPRNEFISFAMADRFSVIGSTYEYLRMTHAVIVITDHVRELIRAELEGL
jgi:hypothetical protein